MGSTIRPNKYKNAVVKFYNKEKYLDPDTLARALSNQKVLFTYIDKICEGINIE